MKILDLILNNLDLVTYKYDLKMNIWRNLHEYQEFTLKWEKTKII